MTHQKFLRSASKQPGHYDRIPWLLPEIYASRKKIVSPKQTQHYVVDYFLIMKKEQKTNWKRKYSRKTFKIFKKILFRNSIYSLK